jgi:uncharacterized protein
MTTFHQVSPDVFGELAAGRGGPEAVRTLRDARLSKHLLLLRHIVQQWPWDIAERTDAIEVLSSAQRASPQIFAHLLSDPMVGAWVARTARRLDDPAGCVPADTGHLAAIAVAAAARTGGDTRLALPVRDGVVPVPTLGAAQVNQASGTTVPVTVRAGELRFGGGSDAVVVADPDVTAGGSWLTLRRLPGAGEARRTGVCLDDLDPYRDCYHVPAAARLPQAQVSRWQTVFADTCELLATHLPRRGAELAEGLRTLVPLRDLGLGRARSATARDAFGACALTPPESPADLALTMIHEFQHSKLSALLDLVRLVAPGGQSRFFAPWRLDPRPAGGLLQGVYAFLAVAEAWRDLRAVPALTSMAEQEFADLREQVSIALHQLRGSGELTSHGERFAEGMQHALNMLMAEPLPGETVWRARTALAANRDRWQERNGAVVAAVAR